ncbi:MAG: DUF4389 domain-containing protein [Hyphomicrobiaceae bacterium]|nr:MAG: DUF4389 domain-containing protein [Hyphomicrobiaceae bacterium]
MQTEADKEQKTDRPSAWKRGLFMLLFAVAFSVGQSLLFLLALVQFLWLLFAGEPNQFLTRFGRSLSAWLAHAARFLSCATDDMPFPWQGWPDAG